MPAVGGPMFGTQSSIRPLAYIQGLSEPWFPSDWDACGT
jgi:hypothetical protein